MADSLIITNSERVNMFLPASTTEDINAKVKELIRTIDKGEMNLCPILVERMARRVAGILHNYSVVYGYTVREVEELLGLNDLRESFACKGVDLYEILDSFDSNDNLLANENLHLITTAENFIIKLTI